MRPHRNEATLQRGRVVGASGRCDDEQWHQHPEINHSKSKDWRELTIRFRGSPATTGTETAFRRFVSVLRADGTSSRMMNAAVATPVRPYWSSRSEGL